MKTAMIGMLLTGLLTAQLANREYALDLVTYPATTPENQRTTGVALPGVVSGSTDSAKNTGSDLTVTLNQIDRTSYVMGDPLIYEVLIRNVGKNAIAVPWSPDVDTFQNVTSTSLVRERIFL